MNLESGGKEGKGSERWRSSHRSWHDSKNQFSWVMRIKNSISQMHYSFWFTYKVLHMILVVGYYICILKMRSGELGAFTDFRNITWSSRMEKWDLGLQIQFNLPRLGCNWKGCSSEPNVWWTGVNSWASGSTLTFHLVKFTDSRLVRWKKS